MEDNKCNAKRGIGEVTIDEDVHFVTPTTTIKKRKVTGTAVGSKYFPMKRRITHRSRRRWKGYPKYRQLLLMWKSRKHERDKNMTEKVRKKLRLTLD
jgi:hypothetical protein